MFNLTPTIANTTSPTTQHPSYIAVVGVLVIGVLIIALLFLFVFRQSGQRQQLVITGIDKADYVGIYIDVSSGEVKILPMKFVKNVLYYYDDDPTKRFFLVAPLPPTARILRFKDKPAVVLVGSSYSALVENPHSLFCLSNELLSLENKLGEVISSDPRGVIDSVLVMLLREVHEVQGRIPVTKEYHIAFPIQRSKIYNDIVMKSFEMMKMIVSTMSDVLRTMDHFYLGLLKRWEAIERTRLELPRMVVMALILVLILLIAFAIYVLR